MKFLSCHSTRYCNGMRSFIGTQVPKTKHNLWQGKFHSTATFFVINQRIVLQRNVGFKCQVLKTPKMNLTGISLQNIAIKGDAEMLVFRIKGDADVLLTACK